MSDLISRQAAIDTAMNDILIINAMIWYGGRSGAHVLIAREAF